jgi:phenylpropionate dioxygenase-like ring-hydroxylating dioxygenase large terminal subunit
MLRAFHNMCTHRGNKLVWSDGGCRKAFTCNFHGWSFNTKGQLVGVPDKDNFYDFQKCKTDLKKVSVDTWEGFVFVNMDEQPAQSLEEYLGEFGKRLHGYPFHELTTCYAYRAEVNVNWKIAIDAFQEAYHAGILHKKSIPSFTARENPYNHPLWIKLYKNGHRTFSVYGNTEYKPTPVEELAFKYGTVTSSALAGRSAGDSRWEGMNPTKSNSWGFDINVVFPNFFVDVLEGTYFTYNFWPVTVDRMIWDVRMYFPKAEKASQRFSQEYSKVALRDTLLEDLATLEKTQSMLRSGAIDSLVLSDGEIAVRHQHKYIEDLIGFYKKPMMECNAKEEE